MTPTQGPKDGCGSRSQEKSGKKKPPTDSDQRTEERFALTETLVKTHRVDQQVEQFNELAQPVVGKAQLKIGLWLLENVFHNDLNSVRSKNPKKQISLAAISKHPRLDPGLRRPRLRRHVVAAAIKRTGTQRG